MRTLRIGHGYDVHRLTEGRALVLGGVTIPHERGLLGHSDADVVLHALMDALLGAAALGDIGRLFPDSDPRYQGADSRVLLREMASRLARAGWAVGNVDVTLVAQRPKVAGRGAGRGQHQGHHRGGPGLHRRGGGHGRPRRGDIDTH